MSSLQAESVKYQLPKSDRSSSSVVLLHSWGFLVILLIHVCPRWPSKYDTHANYFRLKAAKCAVRALADTLRAEALIYSCSASTYKIHCAFPSNFISPAFIDEQNSKPGLTKRMEGTTASTAELGSKLHSSEQVARYIINAVRRGDFAICSELEAAVLFANMIGPSPTRGFGIVDSLLALLMRFIIWPILRYHFDAMCAKENLSPKTETHSVWLLL